MAVKASRAAAAGRRDFKAMERVRLQAARMFEQGASQGEVVRRLGTSRQNVSRWHARWQQGGRAALRAAGRAGRRPQLSRTQRRQLERALLKGARSHEFDTDLWTLGRIAVVIERLTGVRHHPSHVWRVLRQMGWSVQRPARRAAERDEAAIQRWVKQDWPRIRQKRPPAGRVDRLSG
jgi:transposase